MISQRPEKKFKPKQIGQQKKSIENALLKRPKHFNWMIEIIRNTNCPIFAWMFPSFYVVSSYLNIFGDSWGDSVRIFHECFEYIYWFLWMANYFAIYSVMVKFRNPSAWILSVSISEMFIGETTLATLLTFVFWLVSIENIAYCWFNHFTCPLQQGQWRHERAMLQRLTLTNWFN